MMTPYVVRRLMPFVLTAVSSVEHVREYVRWADRGWGPSAADTGIGQYGVAPSAKFVRTVS